MCGRHYSTYTEDEIIFRYFNRKWPFSINKNVPSFRPNYNTCPTQTNLVLAVQGAELGLRSMRWGLVPGWAKSIADADAYSMINAKSEEIEQKRSYSAAFKKRRCIVPVSGFYEWKREGKDKRPFAISLKDEPIMSLAGVYEAWADPQTGADLLSFSIVTTAANTFMTAIHTRMPVILSRDQEVQWLDPEFSDLTTLKSIMHGCADEQMQAIELSKLVNSPKNNSPEVLVPLAS